jgi:hypothetical protein
MLLGIVMFFELVYNSIQLVFIALLLVSFFKRRTIFPTLAIVFYLITLIFLIADNWIVSVLQSTDVTSEENEASLKEIVRSCISTAIWIPYLLQSKRVKHTFVKRVTKKFLPVITSENT